MSADWNLQTNIKARPGSQGTLFSGGKSQMNPQRRWPRGYTPERQREIVRSMGYGIVDHTDPAPIDDGRGEIVPSHAERDVRDAILTSSVPASDVKNLRIHIVGKEGRKYAAEVEADPNVRLSEGTRGLYNNHGRRGEIDVHHEAGAFTVLHEVGHHASMLANTQHSNYDTVRQRGEEEGFADSYAEKHLSPTLRTPRVMHPDDSTGLDDYNPSYGQVGSRENEFFDGYHKTRPMESRVPNAEDKERTARMQTLYNSIHGPKQESLF
jgi:hypothetical protein